MTGARPETARSMIEIGVEVLAGPHPGTGVCLVDGAVAAADLPGLPEPGRLPAASVPEWLAGLVGLGPRPAVEAPGMLVAPAAVLDRLLHSGAASREVPDERWRALLARIAEHRRAWWWVTVGRYGAPPADVLEIIDAGQAGMWSRRPCPDPELAEQPSGAGDPADGAADGAAGDSSGGPGTGAGDGPPMVLAPTTPTEVWAWLSRLAAPDRLFPA